jgi:putative N6-adenine-specific DNA methylase
VVEGGVEFPATAETLYRVNLQARVASRIITRIAEFPATSFAELERRARRVNWDRWLAGGRAVSLRVTCRKSRLYHSDAVAQRIYESIARRVGPVPTVQTSDEIDPPDQSADGAQLLIVRFLRDTCTISLDSSGALLHQRGYRLMTGKAPLRENIAAAMLVESSWRHDCALVDPMCGSGTIPIEAALMSRGVPPGAARRFGFFDWPDFDQRLWKRVHRKAMEGTTTRVAAPIIACDRDAGAIQATTENATRAGVLEDLDIRRQSVSALDRPPHDLGWIVTNPPYGVRVGDRTALRNLYARIGAVLRERFGGWHVGLLSAQAALEAELRIPLEERLDVSNGGIHVRLMCGILPDDGVTERTSRAPTA